MCAVAGWLALVVDYSAAIDLLVDHFDVTAFVAVEIYDIFGLWNERSRLTKRCLLIVCFFLVSYYLFIYLFYFDQIWNTYLYVMRVMLAHIPPKRLSHFDQINKNTQFFVKFIYEIYRLLILLIRCIRISRCLIVLLIWLWLGLLILAGLTCRCVRCIMCG